MKKDKVIVWGTGMEADKLIKIVGVENIAYFADNNEQKCGKYFYGKRILSMREFLHVPEKYLVVISTAKYEKEIKKQLFINGISYVISAKQYIVNRIFQNKRQKAKRVILLNTHDNINIGDHLITVAEQYFFRKYMPDYEIIEVPLTLCSNALDYIFQYVESEDLLVVTGGGFLGSLWLECGEINVRKIVTRFKDNRIIVFPQSIYFENNIEGKRQQEISKRIYNAHRNLTFCIRDEYSYQLATELFAPHIIKKYTPDMVTLLDRSDEIFLRHGILICIREDKERIVPEKSLEEIKRILVRKNYSITRMTMLADEDVTPVNRMDVINVKLRQIQTSRMVITDRLHCMLMCVVSGTPCIAFNNLSGKVHGVYKWIKENSYICKAGTDINIEKKIEELLNMPYMSYKKESVEREFGKLAEFLKTGKV